MTDKQNFLRDHELQFFQDKLDSFVPERVFDAHTHLWRGCHYPHSVPAAFGTDVTCATHRRMLGEVFGDRLIGGWALPKPILRDPDSDALPAAEWVGRCVADERYYRGAFLVRPGDDPEQVRHHVRRLGLSGFKCYHVFAERPSTWEADIPEYLPEGLVRIADQEELVITLHLVKTRGPADEANLHWIRHFCQTYPNMQLILAHSGRAFQPDHNFAALTKLTDLDNLWFDVSANCEPIAHQSIMRIIGPERMMYGTDFGLASHSRGRSVSVADTFLWLYQETPVWQEKHKTIEPVMIMLEALRSLKWACWSERLTDQQVEDIFWGNAARLFKLQ